MTHVGDGVEAVAAASRPRLLPSTVVYLGCVTVFLVTLAIAPRSFTASQLIRSPVFWQLTVLLVFGPSVVAGLVCLPFRLVGKRTPRLFSVTKLGLRITVGLGALLFSLPYWVVAIYSQPDTDSQIISAPIPSPSGALRIVPQATESYAHGDDRVLVTFDLRDRDDEFVSHIQSDTDATEPWQLGWHDDFTVVLVTADDVQAWVVGLEDELDQELGPPFDDDILATAQGLRAQGL